MDSPNPNHQPQANPADQLGVEALADALRQSFKLLRLLMVAVALGYLASGLYVVQQHEKAVVLRWGKVSGLGVDRVKGPGLHWTWPRPISEIVKVPTERVMTLSSDAFWVEPEDPQAPTGDGRLVPGRDGYTLSGDANVLHSQWAVRYTVKDPIRYALFWKDSGEVLDRALHQAVVHVSSRSPIDATLRTEIESFRSQVEQRLRHWGEEVNLGLQLQGVDLVATAPPRQVTESFLEVIRSDQEKFQRISDAQNYATTSINEAQGESKRRVSLGEAERDQLVQRVKANVDYFNQVHEKFKINPRIIARALLQDTLRRTLDQVDEKYVVDSGDQEIRITVSSDADRKPKDMH